MKELLANTVQTIKQNIYNDGVATAATGTVAVKIFKGSVQIISATATSIATGKYSYTVPSTATVGPDVYDILGVEGEFTVVWEFTVAGSAFSVSEVYRVVTPYAYWSTFESSGSSYADFREAERVARYIINYYCGQSFGKETTTLSVEGHGTDSLMLPRRLISLTSVTYTDFETRPGTVIGVPDDVWELTADNWVLRPQPQNLGLNIVNDVTTFFDRNKHYVVTGLWGYESVPAEVQEAANILVADYLCADHKYRDKYLESVKMNDWRLEFHDKAFQGTGNATADSLLKDFRNNYIGLI